MEHPGGASWLFAALRAKPPIEAVDSQALAYCLESL
jgi:hypothetical protein